MFTAAGIQALVSQPESFHRTSSHDVGFHNLVYIIQRDSSIPDCFRINHNVWPMLALIQAAGVIGANSALQSELRQFLLESRVQFGPSARIAAAAHMALGAHIAADENVAFKFRHGSMVQEECQGIGAATRGSLPVASWLGYIEVPDSSETGQNQPLIF
jgi:hypothetical protein